MTEPPSYDETSLTERLHELSTWQRSAVAASCAQRLAPAFRRYAEIDGQDAGRTEVVQDALDLLWRTLSGHVSNQDLASLAETSEAAVPGEDEWNEWADLAEHAAAATAYAIRSWLTGDVEFVVWAARQAYHAADLVASAQLNPAVIDEAAEGHLRGSESVRRENLNRAEDIRVVEAAPDGDAGTVADLHARSTAAAQRLIDEAALVWTVDPLS
jgi:uncharacterized protein YjaG (DUF416 family)